MSTPLVILMGNPVDGFVVIGPFNHLDDAVAYIDSDPEGGEMWLCELQAPALPEEVTS